MLTWLNALIDGVAFIHKQFGAMGCLFFGLLALAGLGLFFWLLDTYTLFDLLRLGTAS